MTKPDALNTIAEAALPDIKALIHAACAEVEKPSERTRMKLAEALLKLGVRPTPNR